METRRPRLIIKAWLRGLLPTYRRKYGVRSIARLNVILLSLAAEEEYVTAKDSVMFYSQLIGNHITDNRQLVDFIDHLGSLLKYASDRYQLIKSSPDQSDKEQRLINNDATHRLVNDFNYMKKHGILDKMKKEMLEHRKKHNLQ